MEIVFGTIVLLVGLILAALFVALVAAWAITGGGLILAALRDLFP